MGNADLERFCVLHGFVLVDGNNLLDFFFGFGRDFLWSKRLGGLSLMLKFRTGD